MIEPTMNAMPPRKNSRSQTSTAASTLSAKPVSEIALGVSRDSISAVAHELAPLARADRRARPRRPAR